MTVSLPPALRMGGQCVMAMLMGWLFAAVFWVTVSWCENCPFGAIYIWIKGLFLPVALSWSWVQVPPTHDRDILKVFQHKTGCGHVWRGLRCSHCPGVGQCGLGR